MSLETTTEVEAETQTQITDTAAPSAKRERAKANTETGVVTFRGVDRQFDDLPDASKRHAGIIGLARMLRETDGEAWSKLVAGNLSVAKKSAKVKELDDWRTAYAHALAEETVKGDGGRVRNGTKDTPEFTAALDAALAKARDLDRKGLAKAKVIPAVVIHHARITGTPVVSLASILG